MAWFRPFAVTGVAFGVALAGCGSSDDSSLFNGQTGGSGGNAGSSAGGSAQGGSTNGGSSAGGSSSGGQAGSTTGGSGAQGGAGANGGSAGTNGGSAGNAGSAGSNTGGSAGTGSGGNAGSAGTGTAGSAGTGTAGSSSGGNSSGGTGGTGGCKTNSDCPESDQYCQKQHCGDQTGQCVKRGDGCGQTQDIVCGCDGVSYWNSCLAARSGVNIAGKGECTGSGTRTCLGIAGLQCPNGAKCAQLTDSCNISDVGGTCWVIPNSCPGVVVGADYRECGPNPSAGCHSLCEAIAAEKPHRRDNTCPQ